MITHATLAGLCAALYVQGGSPAAPYGAALPPMPQWLYVSPPGANYYIGILRIGDMLFVFFRGSFTFKDWLHDLLALARNTDDTEWGPVHSGFLIGLEEAFSIIKPFYRPGDRVVLIGHSLGASHATVMAAKLKSAGIIPYLTVCWGEPMSGFQQLADFLKDVPGVSYRNTNVHHTDIVTTVPFPLPPLLYVHRTVLTDVCAPPVGGDILDDLGLFAWHHFSLYMSATPARIL